MRTLPALLATGALAVAGCGSTAATTTQPGAPSESAARPAVTGSPSPAVTSSPPVAAAAPSVATPERQGRRITVGASQLGQVLFDGSGQAIYLFDKEGTGAPECYGGCAEAWPPVLTRGAPQARRGVRQRLLGTTRRTDGSVQVTYAGHPLYFYAHEQKWEVRCHNVTGFGGLWLALTPSGRPPA